MAFIFSVLHKTPTIHNCNQLYEIPLNSLYPTWKKFRGIFFNHSVRLSVRPSVCAYSCLDHNFFIVWHSLIISGTWVYNHKTMCRVHSWSRYDLELWPQSQIYRVFDIFLCPFHNDFLFDIGLPDLAHGSITMRRYDKYIHVPDLMLTSDFKVKFIGLLSCFHVRPVTSVSFHIGIPFSAHGSITVRECVKYIHDPNTTLTFNLKDKFIGFMAWLCVLASAFFWP